MLSSIYRGYIYMISYTRKNYLLGELSRRQGRRGGERAVQKSKYDEYVRVPYDSKKNDQDGGRDPFFSLNRTVLS